MATVTNPAVDDPRLLSVTRDISGGVNTRQSEDVIADNEVTVLLNADINVLGQSTKRSGITTMANTFSNIATGMGSFYPRIAGGTDAIYIAEGSNVRKWTGSGNWSSSIISTLTSTVSKTAIVQGQGSGGATLASGEIVFVSNGTDNVKAIDKNDLVQDLGDTNTSPPKSTAMCWFRGRLWVLWQNKLYYSDAVDEDYSGAFNRTTNYFNMPVGQEMALVPIRDTGLMCFGRSAVYGINPSVVPVATDKMELISDKGCLSGDSVVMVGDDIIWLSQDGVRSLKRTQQDKMQVGASYPLSYKIKTEIDNISLAYAHLSKAEEFNNRYILTFTKVGSTTNNRVIVYYPAFNSWSVWTGLNIGCMKKFEVSGEVRLYGCDSTTGISYRILSGLTDNGTAITFQEEGRRDDLKHPEANKWGGEFELECNAGSGVVTVSADVDNSGYQLLGTVDTGTTNITFPVTFPVDFSSAGGKVWEKFHIDTLGAWRGFKYKLVENGSASSIVVTKRQLSTHLEQYEGE